LLFYERHRYASSIALIRYFSVEGIQVRMAKCHSHGNTSKMRDGIVSLLDEPPSFTNKHVDNKFGYNGQ
jgi:hypothetical protein